MTGRCWATARSLSATDSPSGLIRNRSIPASSVSCIARPRLPELGVGAALLDHAIAEARTRGCDAMQLSVYGENFGAQRFYQRYGFAHVADIDFWVGSHRDDEFLYELAL